MTKPTALLEQAIRHFKAGRSAEAAELCQSILQIDDAQPFAHDLLGQVALQHGELENAAGHFARAIEIRPAAAGFHLNLGLALRRLGRTEAAIAAVGVARAMDPRSFEAHYQLGNLLKGAGRHEEAARVLREAVRLAPKHAAAWLNLGAACLKSRVLEDAVKAFQRALKLEPGRPEAHNILGHALSLSGRSQQAEAAFKEALRLQPGFAPAHDNLGRLCRSTGRLAEAIAHYRAAIASKPDPYTHSNLLFALNFLPGLPPGEVFAEHRRWQESYAAPLPLLPRRTPVSSDRGRRLRVGYISPDFAHHAVAYFIEPVLASHDRERCEVFCYASVAQPDRFTARLRGLAEHWRDIAALGDEAAAGLIQTDELDLLVDLAGHTANHRLLVLARRPAAVQATWIGYPNTTGLSAIDYRITDAISDPPGTTEAYYSEKIVRLPTSFSCYRPDDEAPPVNALPAAANPGVTFASLNQYAKVTPGVIAVWARVLQEVPGSRLLLKAPGRSDAGVAAQIRTAFAGAGITGDRIMLHGDRLPTAAHLALYHNVDIALDPFPYNGTTTTCEALWMGVPVLTLAGQTHVARVGASLLTHAGLPEWIANSPEGYVQRAVSATRDLPALATLRLGLRERLRRSPLCDAVNFTCRLEKAYAAMIKANPSGRPD
jgi:protein O-GlcNAc transferase